MHVSIHPLLVMEFFFFKFTAHFYYIVDPL